MKSDALLTLLKTVAGTMPRQMGTALVLMLLVGFTQGVGLLMLLPLLHLVGVDTGQGAAGRFVDLIEGAFAALNVPVSLESVLLTFILIMCLTALMRRWSTLTTAALQIEFAGYVQRRLFNGIARSNWLFFSKRRGSDFTHTITDEVMRMTAAMDSLLRMTATLVTGMIYVVLAMVLAPLLTGLVFLVGSFMALVFRRYNRIAHGLGKNWQEAKRAIYAALHECFSGMRVIKGHGIVEQQTSVFSRLVDRFVGVSLASSTSRANLAFLLSVSSVLILSAFVYAALTILQVSAAGLLMLLFLFSRLIPTFTGLQSQYQTFSNMQPAFESIQDLLLRSEAASEASERVDDIRLTREIRLEDATFSYDPTSAAPAVANLNMTLRAGETTAVVGPSGGGKSTIADLLIGLVSPSQGRVLIDDRPLSAERFPAWRQQVGYVPQDTFMFHDTVRSNLVFARPAAGEADIMEALRFACADEFVKKLPEGLDTVIGDRGVRLSGGERQRLALARAILRRPALLVLDEATSSLDIENEWRIQKAIDRMRGKMTILVIAHRLSTVRNANLIYVLDRGRIVESGGWQELMEREDSRLMSLYKEQAVGSVQASNVT